MPDVKFSNQYPYTDFHELNLDWVIKEVKYWSTRVGKTIQSIELTGTAGLVDTYTINYSDGSTSTFDVTNGNGIASVAKTGTVGLVDTYTITFQDGNTSTFNVTNGTASIDPTLTLPNYAADAQATGKEINDINALLNGQVNTYCTLENGSIYNPANSFGVHTSNYIPCSYGMTVTMVPVRPSTVGYYYVFAYTIYDSAYNDILHDSNAQPYYQTIAITPTNAAYIQFSIFEYNGNTYTTLRKNTFGYIPYATATVSDPIVDRIENLENNGANNNVFSVPNYTFVTGTPWNMYFSGAWLRNAEYKRTTNGNGQYADRFVYAAASPGTANSTIQLFDNNFDSIGQHLMSMKYATPSYRNLTAMFLGDSTINNGSITAKVLDVFTDNGVVCTLLGTRGSGTNKHEGRSGWTAADYMTAGRGGITNPFYNPITQTFDFSYYMTQQGYSAPDFVFIQLGINDMFSVSMPGFETGYNTFKTNMLTIINSIHNYNASIKIVINLILMPNGNISAFNTLYGANYYNWERRYIDVMTNSRLISDMPSYVLLNPHNLILDPMTMISDDVHPTSAGYELLGEFDANYMFAN